MSGFGEIGNLLKQAQEMQRQIDKTRAELRTRTVEGTAGGGVVRVEISADRHEVRRIALAPEVLRTPEPGLVEDLVRSALQDALRKASETEAAALARVTGGLSLPGLL
jgi:DNA-binding YbaB/EbfC family protein